MFTSNPFAELSAFVPPAVMQTYIVVMVLLVAGGTLFDIMHKKSARYFFDNWRESKNKGDAAGRRRGNGVPGDADRCVEVLTSGEFCSARRRIAHLLTMYGFLVYVVTTVDHGFRLPDARHPDARYATGTVVHRRADGLPRRLLVLVLHPGRRRRRRQLAVPPRAR